MNGDPPVIGVSPPGTFIFKKIICVNTMENIHPVALPCKFIAHAVDKNAIPTKVMRWIKGCHH
jgi:hypothetical protein